MFNTILIYSELENGISVPGRYEIGDTVETQWGTRRVVRVYSVVVDGRDDVPYGC